MNKEAEQWKHEYEVLDACLELAQGKIEQLKAENDKLKHSNENLRLALKTYEMPEVVKVLTDWRTGELDLRINKYKQTLQEIKKIAERQLLVTNVRTYQMVYYADFSEYRNEILQKITKAEEE